MKSTTSGRVKNAPRASSPPLDARVSDALATGHSSPVSAARACCGSASASSNGEYMKCLFDAQDGLRVDAQDGLRADAQDGLRADRV